MRIHVQNPYRWHQWFAWYPVNIVGTDTIAWLEPVERRRSTDPFGGWSHRLIN